MRRRTIAHVSVQIVLIILGFRTRELARRMDLLLSSRDRHHESLDMWGNRYHHGGPQHRPEEEAIIEQFISKVEQLDGMTESLRILLNVALTKEDNTSGSTTTTFSTTATTQMDDDEARCQRFGFTISNPFRRRRIFWGSLLADDSWHVLSLAAVELQGMLHTISFIESNTTQTRTPRQLRYPPHSERLELVTSPLLWGDQARVHVDYHVDDDDDHHPADDRRRSSLWRENNQRARIFQRWKQNGMRDDDIGYVSDMDEVATRDFLRALQVCNVPEFTTTILQNQQATIDPTNNNNTMMHHDCVKPKLSSSTIVYEGSPMCLQIPRRWGRPDWVIGECIQGIGNDTNHPPAPRTDRTGMLERVKHWSQLVANGTYGNYSNNGPLWDATDIRMIPSRRVAGTTSVGIPHMLPTAYHFHNFFDSFTVVRRKYKTYGHPKAGALELPLGDIQTNDLGFLVDCLTGRSNSGSKWRQPGPSDWFLMDTVYGTPRALGPELRPAATPRITN